MGQVLALRVTLCGGRPALRPGCGETSPSPRVRSSGLWGATLWCDGRPIVSLRRIAQPPQRPPPAPAGAVLPSIIAEVPLFQTSISLYEAYCSWGMVTYIAVVAYLGLVVTVVLAHCIYARQRGQLSSWLVESFASMSSPLALSFFPLTLGALEPSLEERCAIPHGDGTRTILGTLSVCLLLHVAFLFCALAVLRWFRHSGHRSTFTTGFSDGSSLCSPGTHLGGPS
mmetsp:Transcript_10913/g.31323  ORF Transcript_10913/g.31323 Transcript_10913/m.31323 type:complete len:227 (+) Transcript_10913:452-1132(+)